MTRALSLRAWKAAGIVLCAALILGLWARGVHHARRAETGETLLRAALAMSEANAALAQGRAAAAARIDAAARLAALRQQQIRADAAARRKEIADAPPDMDGPLAPVLRDQLERLPEPPGADPGRRPAAAARP